ncbi:MAG: hypothetical protein SOZ34_09900 [Clostridia bacterium]|nr:hypothetical protein [Clostridia bacterium]
MYKIFLKEHIGLENYCWENSLLTYKVGGGQEGNTLCLSGSDKKIPCQITDCGNGECSLSFVTGLKCGEEKEFFLVNDDTEYKKIGYTANDSVILENENIRLEIDNNTKTLFSIKKIMNNVTGKAELSEEVLNKSVRIVENGTVFAIVHILAELKNGDTYGINIRLAREQEFVSLTERINTNGGKMRISWQNFDAKKRISCGLRGEQYIDEYLKPNKEIPVMLLPHDVTNGVVESNYITFFNDECSVGVFIGDSVKWDDGSYSIQSNNKINGVRFYYHENAIDKLVWEYPLNKGSRETCIAMYNSEKKYNSKLRSHIKELQFWNYYLPLDLYKDWIFDYDDSNEKYPKYFDKEKFDKNKKYNYPGGYDENGIPPADEVLKRITDSGIIADPWHFGPVWSRAFGEIIPLLDLRANEMQREDFVKGRKICILFAYYAMLENPFPSRHTLAGHANFFMDYVSIVGLAAAMFPHHPAAEEWKNYYHRAVLLNMKFYVRPDVKTWKAKGGRSCENLGCYSWAGLRHILGTGEMLKYTFDDNPSFHKNFEKWADWFLNSLSAPIEGRRAFPPLGAHAGGHILNPYYPTFWFRVMGNMLRNYSPILAEQILNVCPAEPLVQFENFEKNDVWSYLNNNTDITNTGIKPHLKSEKYTGYGYILRSHVNEKSEMCVFLQQIDEGPNYRWGSSCSGGCGNIYYYADNKRYSDNRKEDVGDDIMADGDTSCTFAVLQNHTYTSIGKNELTYPLSDFEFCQYARVNAGEYSSDEYKFRSILMVDNDYIAIYDSVRDFRTQGRFSWFSNTDDDMPYIFQLKPGIEPRKVTSPAMTIDGKEYDHRANVMEIPYKTRGVMYDGRGDFFTIVTHKKDLQVQGKEYGAVVIKKGCTDYVFDTPYRMTVCEKNVEFDGKVGFVRIYSEEEYDMAIFDADFIKAYGTWIRVKPLSENFSISLSKRNGRYYGKCEGHAKVTICADDISEHSLYVNSELTDFHKDCIVELKDCEWELTNGEPTPSEIENITYCEKKDGVTISWNGRNCSEYIVKVNNLTYTTNNSSIDLQLDEGKYIVNICGKNNGQLGRQSMDYPMYITKKPPERVEGVLVTRHSEFIDISWGQQLGVKAYNLYRINENNNTEKIYSGTKTAFSDMIQSNDVKYYVTAENEIGESRASIIRDTARGDMADWDPIPETEFVRDTINNEHGHPGFDYKYNENRRILEYPD